MANDNATQQADVLPEDGPWSMDPMALSKAAGNTSVDAPSVVDRALVPDIDAPWAMDGASLASITNNVKPDPAPVQPVDPSKQPQPVTVSGLFAKLVNTESGGKHVDANGNLITSSKGAKGITQVIPATGGDPGYGVTPLQNQSVEEYLRFGKDYLGAMIRNFGGDVQKGVAAYNAGPGNVQNAVAKAQQAGRPDAWPQFLPKPSETIPYLNKIVGTLTGSTDANAAADFSNYVATNKVQTGPTVTQGAGKNPATSYEYQTNALAPWLQKTIQDKFPQFVDAINTKITGEKAAEGNTAEYGGLAGDTIKLGNLQGSLTTWKTAMGKPTGNTGIQGSIPNEALTTTLHELMHARMSKIGSFNDGIGDNWKDMLKDAENAGFPSVHGDTPNGDMLNEFLATATTLKEMQKANIAPGGRYVPVAKALPAMEQKYPWLKQYIINYINPEAANNANNRQAVEEARSKK